MVSPVRDVQVPELPIPCTICGDCMPCPNGVDIPWNFEIYNCGAVYGHWAHMRLIYEEAAKETRASSCTRCRECEKNCPQHLSIGDWLMAVRKALGSEVDFDDGRARLRFICDVL